MKKRKVYEISVIDKTYSKTISDETKFYTSDTALELVFKLKETEYTFDSAEIVLLNENDKSLITRRVFKSNDGFVYEFEKDVIAHYGEWKAQLMLIENGEAHVSSPIKFRIENDLYNTKPQTLSDVVSWVNLKLYAEKMVGEFKQAVDEAFAKNVEIENTFKTNEQNRQTAFENAEQSRKTTFNSSESERDETFNTNESARQSQELEREKAETQRQTIFDENESIRTETFNTNEATRQANESTRQQAESTRQSTFEVNETERQTTFETAEQERQSAELIRVENENQRKTDHVNRSAEFASKADKFVIENLIENGDFSQGTTGWEFGQFSSNMVVSDGVSKVDARYVAYSPYHSTPIDKDKKYFISSKIKNVDLTSSIMPSYALTNGNSTLSESQYMGNYFDEIDTEKFSRVSRVVTANDNYTSVALMRFTTNLSSAQSAYFDDVIFVNLTDTFGAGNEPTKEEMDELIKVTGYIDDEYALNNKDILIWTLALIRRNKNAITALGGTI